MMYNFFLFAFALSSVSSNLIQVEEGKIEGTVYELPNGRSVQAFYGVPYAAPPIGEYRFAAPQPRKPWQGVWNASVPVSACLQLEHFNYSVNGEEDCLYLNIFTPEVPRETKSLMPVLFYIHGGAFMYGAGSTTRPDYIMQTESIVYVSVNYRLNAFGFLSTGDNVVPGNNGLKDQVAALKWVQRNIAKFGGDPSSVTILGCSAGGASVHYQFLSPSSQGLFHRGISLSGSTLLPWTLSKTNADKSKELAKLLGCPSQSTEEMVACLRTRPSRHILEQLASNFMPWRFSPFTPIGPVVEPPNPEAFLTEEPLSLLKRGQIKDLPWVISLCKEEGLYPAADFVGKDELLRELQTKWFEIAPHLLMYNFSVRTDVERNEISANIKKFYFADTPISSETITNIIQLLGDRAFYNGITRATKLHAAAVRNNVYSYLFSYRGKYSQSDVFGQNTVDLGVSHADDLNYVLNILSLNTQENESDRAMVLLMSSMFASFMRTGEPKINGVQWTPIAKNINEPLRLLNIHSPQVAQMEIYNNSRTLEFWKNLLPSEPENSIELKTNSRIEL